jgi:hypothetical protein
MGDKTIGVWLIVDWRKGQTRTRKSEPKASELGTNELKAKVEIDVTVPDVDVPTLSLEIDVPEPRVYAATIEALSDDDLPEWSEVAIDKVEQNQIPFEDAGNAPEWKEAVDTVSMDTLRDAPGRPDVEAVRHFVDKTARDIHDVAVPEGVGV